MAINKDSNTYTIGFAIILVVLVGGLLAMIANGLKPIQDENLVNEKKQNILTIARITNNNIRTTKKSHKKCHSTNGNTWYKLA